MKEKYFCEFYDKNKPECKSCEKESTSRFIIIECKSFYQTFIDLDKNIVPAWLNMKNSVFDEEIHNTALLYEFSYVVNGAFAAELALKYLLTLAGIEYSTGAKGHELAYLFGLIIDSNKLSIKQDKEHLVDVLCSQCCQNCETLKLNLQNLTNLYNSYRYAFSCKNVSCNNGFFRRFVHIVCKYSIDKANSLHKEDEDIAKLNVTLPDMSDSEYWNLV